MTQSPNRLITGLGAPRAGSGAVQADASRLLARNRASAPAPAAPVVPPRTRTAKEQLNVAVPSDVRARIRAAYRYTSVPEGHRSFSDLITALLEAEAKRLEATYNHGQPFTGGDEALPPGRRWASDQDRPVVGGGPPDITTSMS